MNRQAMRRCGKQFPSREAALASRGGRRPDREVPEGVCRCGGFHVRAKKTVVSPVAAPARRPRKTGAATGLPKPPSGFTSRVRLIVRTRAGQGDPAQARCEACGKRLGRRGGQMQHRDARGIGGTRDRVLNGPANAALLCGTPQSGCHGRCEKRDKRMLAAGWWIPSGNGPDYDPRYALVQLWTPDGPAEKWLGEDGSYLDTSPLPQGVAA